MITIKKEVKAEIRIDKMNLKDAIAEYLADRHEEPPAYAIYDFFDAAGNQVEVLTVVVTYETEEKKDRN